MCFRIIERCHPFDDRGRFWPSHLCDVVHSQIDEGLFFFFHVGKRNFIDAQIQQQLAVGWQRIFCLPVRKKVTVNIPRGRS